MDRAITLDRNDNEQIQLAISKTVAETLKILEESARARDEGAKLRAETAKIEAEHRHYLKITFITLLVSALGTCAAVIAAALKLTF
jgi:hypothetical protein